MAGVLSVYGTVYGTVYGRMVVDQVCPYWGRKPHRGRGCVHGSTGRLFSYILAAYGTVGGAAVYGSTGSLVSWIPTVYGTMGGVAMRWKTRKSGCWKKT